MDLWTSIRAFISALILAFVFLLAYFSVTNLGGLSLWFFGILAFAALLIFPMWLGELRRNPKTRKATGRLICGVVAFASGLMAFQSLTSTYPKVCGNVGKAAAGCTFENSIHALAGVPGVFTLYAAFSLLFAIGLFWPAISVKQA